MTEYWNNKINNPKNFIFGYGSIINDNSRMCTCLHTENSIPVRISKKFGYRRCWNYENSKKKITALGLEKTKTNASTINGVIYSIGEDNIKFFDEREEGYKRIKIPLKYIQEIGWECLPKHKCTIWTYIPKDEYKTLELQYPLRQSYIDICMNGAIKFGKEYAIEFLKTTYNWSSNILKNRTSVNPDFVNKKNNKIIDQLLSKYT